MNKHFERDLEKLKILLREQMERIRTNARIVLLMGGEGEGLVPDDVLDEEEVTLEEECLKLSALHQPVAVDLRYLTAVLKSNRDLERIGDLLERVKESTAHAAELQEAMSGSEVDVVRLFGRVETGVSDACRCLDELDGDLARRIWAENKEVTGMCDRVSEGIRKKVLAGEASERLLDGLVSMRHLTRIADHAANIAKNVLYEETGEIVRHRRKEVLGDMPLSSSD